MSSLQRFSRLRRTDLRSCAIAPPAPCSSSGVEIAAHASHCPLSRSPSALAPPPLSSGRHARIAVSSSIGTSVPQPKPDVFQSAGRRHTPHAAGSAPPSVSASGSARAWCAGSSSGARAVPPSSCEAIASSSELAVSLTISTGERTTSTRWPRSKRPWHSSAPCSAAPSPPATAASASGSPPSLGRSSCSEEYTKAAVTCMVSGSC